MPQKKDAEAATVEEAVEPAVEPEASGNIKNELSDLQALVLAQNEMITRLGEQVAEFSKTARPAEPKIKGGGLAAPLPEGWRRYAARFTELTLIRVPGKRLVINGEKVFQEAIAADFSGGVYETDDPDEIAWLESHPDFNVSFWQDDYAIKRHSTVEVQQGVRSVQPVQQAREPLSAPMT